MAAFRYLGFLKFTFLPVGAVKRPILHHYTKYRRYHDFCDFQDGGAAISDLKKKFLFLTAVCCKEPIFVTVPTLMKISKTVVEIW